MFLEQVQKQYENHANKTQMHIELEVGQHVWLNIQDFKMSDGFAPCFITKYIGPYEILHKLHPNVYTLKLLVNLHVQPFMYQNLDCFYVMTKD
jgi:hypothetical protein